MIAENHSTALSLASLATNLFWIAAVTDDNDGAYPVLATGLKRYVVPAVVEAVHGTVSSSDALLLTFETVRIALKPTIFRVIPASTFANQLVPTPVTVVESCVTVTVPVE
jgi:hypothetical protein